MSRTTALTIGSFDAVHRGHIALVKRARHLVGPSDDGGRVIALAFDPHPASILRPAHIPGRLTTFERRSQLLRSAGADQVIRLEPTGDLLNLSPDQFIQSVVDQYQPGVIVEGRDFRFGHQRRGDITLLGSFAGRFNFQLHVVEPVQVDLADQTIVTASSTITRWLLAQGRVADAARVLDRPFEFVGTVVRGDQRGRDLGFPTANLDTLCMIPADGVYAGLAELPSGRVLPAAIHIGPRATFDSPQRTVEAHILDWSAPHVDTLNRDYDWSLGLRFCAWIRDQVRFESAQALIEQIQRDITDVRTTLTLRQAGSTAPSMQEISA